MNRPLVLVDADTLGRQRTGDESYVENLLRELVLLQPPFRLAAVVRRPGGCSPPVQAIVLSEHSQVLRMCLRLPWLLRRFAPALAHFQYVVPPLTRSRVVLSVHDLSFELLPEVTRWRDRLIFRSAVPWSARRADRVVVPSEWTKNDLLERYKLGEHKVVVTPYGVDPYFGPGERKQQPHPFLLMVGALQARKDPVTALEALALLPTDVRLVLAGPTKRGLRLVNETILRLRLEKRVDVLGYVDKPRLAALYRNAACLVHSSLYEGFGLPIVEAMACGTPVVAVAAGAVPEVAGEAALLVPPRDPGALATAIQTALSQGTNLANAGLQRSKAFSWARTASLTAEVYQELL
jgi:glycosyltransferase involved in cell wall biosynthesis